MTFAHWKNGRRVEFSTNAPVTNYYTPGNARYLRHFELDYFTKRILSGDTVLIGADYYALTGISFEFFPREFIEAAWDTLSKGGVIYARIFTKDRLTNFEVIR